MTETNRRVGTASKQAVHYRNYRRCRDRALRRLASEYPEQYRQFLDEERAKDEAEGKAWLDISGRTRRDSLANAAHSGGKDAKGLSNLISPRNLGGEA